MIEIEEWGHDFTIVVGSSFEYLPGFYSLFNSALLNGFKGKFKLAFDNKNLSLPFKFRHPQLEIVYYEGLGSEYYPSTGKLALLKDLPAGKYLYLDADIIIERPCSSICSAVENLLVFAAEPYQMYSFDDLLIHAQKKILNIKGNLPELPYLNAGFLGFMMPRDNDLINRWHDHSKKHLKGSNNIYMHDCFYFVEQDILNLLVRDEYRKGKEFVILSPNKYEMPGYKYFSKSPLYLREFPFYLKKIQSFRPRLEERYIVHGAGMRRPWLHPYPDRILFSRKQKMKRALLKVFCFNISKNDSQQQLLIYGRTWPHYRSDNTEMYELPTPYERGWAYYSCNNQEALPIKISDWAESHNFTEYKNKKWRQIHCLRD